jgi:hypothetical protein
VYTRAPQGIILERRTRGDLDAFVEQPTRVQEHLALGELVRHSRRGEVSSASHVRTRRAEHNVEREVTGIVVQLDTAVLPCRIVLGDVRRVLALGIKLENT